MEALIKIMNEKNFLKNLTIVTDTREQRPYSFDGYKNIVKTLSVGDYSLLHCEHQVSIERKSIDDLIGTLTKGRDRFEKELQKGSMMPYFALIIEGSLSDLATGKYQSDMLPKATVQSLMSFSVKYRLPIFFCESRAYAERVTLSLLLKYGRIIFQKYRVLAK